MVDRYQLWPRGDTVVGRGEIVELGAVFGGAEWWIMSSSSILLREDLSEEMSLRGVRVLLTLDCHWRSRAALLGIRAHLIHSVRG